MKTPNKKSAGKGTVAKKNSASKKTTPKPPLGFATSDDDEDFDVDNCNNAIFKQQLTAAIVIIIMLQ